MRIGTFTINDRISYGIVRDERVLDAGLHLGQRFPDLRSVISAGALDQLEDAALDKGVNVDLRDVQPELEPRPPPGHPRHLPEQRHAAQRRPESGS